MAAIKRSAPLTMDLRAAPIAGTPAGVSRAAIMPCDLIAKHVGELYQCFIENNYITIRTPFIFPDGDIIELYYQETPSGGVLTDFGETLRWLSGQTPAQRRTTRHIKLIEDACSTHQVEFANDQVSVHVPHPELMAEAITRLAQAAIRITDVSFTFRARQFESFADEVHDFLIEKDVPLERNYKVEGESGEMWTIDFKTHRPTKDSLIYALSTENRAQARRLTDRVVAAFYDLKRLRSEIPPVNFVSLVDDSTDAWELEDFKRLEALSAVASWSRQDDFLERLAA